MYGVHLKLCKITLLVLRIYKKNLSKWSIRYQFYFFVITFIIVIKRATYTFNFYYTIFIHSLN